MDANTIRRAFIDFYIQRGHAPIPAAPLVPPEDPTTLFTGSGMQQLVPYLKGESHPMGKRLVNSQPCFRAEDIEEIGDNRHTTFFEMLGNWSLGDYFKQEQLPWFWEFLTTVLKLPKERLWVSIFGGEKAFEVIDKEGKKNPLTPDHESKGLWLKLGVPENHIFAYDASKNWWSRAGEPQKMPVGEIGGPDSEVFFEFKQIKHDFRFGTACHPNCQCGRFLEIGNSVFMQYEKVDKTTFKELPNKNVDFGGGLERIAAAVQDSPDIYEIKLFQPLVRSVLNNYGLAIVDEGKIYKAEDYPLAPESAPIHEEKDEEDLRTKVIHSVRITLDHTRASTFMIASGIEPSNKLQGYVLRRLLRRSMVRMSSLRRQDLREYLETQQFSKLTLAVSKTYMNHYSELFTDIEAITQIVDEEQENFAKNMRTAYPAVIKVINKSTDVIDGVDAFDLFQTHGVLPPVLEEVANRFGKKVDWPSFKKLVAKHQDESRTASTGMFKGGLADHLAATVKLHTATHLLHQALRMTLGDTVHQEGSHITAERLRFDFSHSKPLTAEEIKKIETIMNQVVKKNLPVHKTIEEKDAALTSGALAFFKEKYPDKVSVYTIGTNPDKDWFSKELCGGPHVTSTGEIGTVRIKKQEGLGGNHRRLYAVIE